jgi:hypothetical protein
MRFAMIATVVHPLLWLLSVFALSSWAEARLGHTPRPLLDDPGTFDGWFAWCYHGSLLLMLAWLPVTLGSVVAALVLTNAGRLPRGAGATWIVTLFASSTLTLFVVVTNPARVMAWYLD